jgi:hypothetical protein
VGARAVCRGSKEHYCLFLQQLLLCAVAWAVCCTAAVRASLACRWQVAVAVASRAVCAGALVAGVAKQEALNTQGCGACVLTCCMAEATVQTGLGTPACQVSDTLCHGSLQPASASCQLSELLCQHEVVFMLLTACASDVCRHGGYAVVHLPHHLGPG